MRKIAMLLVTLVCFAGMYSCTPERASNATDQYGCCTDDGDIPPPPPPPPPGGGSGGD